jgi:hypothetical protein
LNRSIPFLGYLDYQLDAKIGGGLFRAALHGEVKGILHTSQETDLYGIRFCFSLRCSFLGWLLGGWLLGSRFLGRWLFGSRFLGCGLLGCG